jgi:hypothetical protein
MTKILAFIDGYKTYLVAIAGIAFGVCVILGLVTGDQLRNWADVIGGAIILVAAALGTIRSAIGKIGK